MAQVELEDNVRVLATLEPEAQGLFSQEALRFIRKLTRMYASRIDRLLTAREQRQAEINSGMLPDFRAETKNIRTSDWKVSTIPPDLQDRKVEILVTSSDRSALFDALNSGASAVVVDFEDSLSPTWRNVIVGQVNLRDACRGKLSLDSKRGTTGSHAPPIMVRPRALHQFEKHVEIDGKPVPAAIFDYGLHAFHNATELVGNGSGLYLYLPKLESSREAKTWRDIFRTVEEELYMKHGRIKVTILIETVPAAFEIDEILFELKDYAVALKCGGSDYMFSFVKNFRNDPQFVLADRRELVPARLGPLSNLDNLIIRTSRLRGVYSIGGISQFIPIESHDESNVEAYERIKLEKKAEARVGFDGTQVTNARLVSIAKAAFEEGAKKSERAPNDSKLLQEDLLSVPKGEITEDELSSNIRIGIEYLEAWLRGQGTVALYGADEHASAAELSRAQLWQWIHHGTIMKDGGRVSELLVKRLIGRELMRLAFELGEQEYHKRQYALASEIFGRAVIAKEFPDYLISTIGYDYLLCLERSGVIQPPPHSIQC